MKQLVLSLIFLMTVTTAFAQTTITPDTTKTKLQSAKLHNVIGVDVTELFTQIFNSNSDNFYYRFPEMFTYRYMCKNHGFRIAFGGTFSSNKGATNDTLGNKSADNSVNIRIGYEHYSFLNKRWTFYFGIDAIGSYQSSDDKYSYSATSYNEQTSSTFDYGVSPLFGMSFKINRWLSLAVETSYDVYLTQSNSKDTDTPADQYSSKSKSNGFGTQFNAPVDISARVKF